MLLRKFIKVYFRYFIPLSKRLVRLLFRGKRNPSLKIFNFSTSEENLYRVKTEFKLQIENGLFLIVNGNVMPITTDQQSIIMRVPVSKEEQEVEVIVRGLFRAIRKTHVVNSRVVQAQTPRFNKSALFKERTLTLKQPRVKGIESRILLNQTPKIKESKIRDVQFALKQHRDKINMEIKDLELELKTKSINHG